LLAVVSAIAAASSTIHQVATARVRASCASRSATTSAIGRTICASPRRVNENQKVDGINGDVVQTPRTATLYAGAPERSD
jgi:hypothetical protein